MPDANKTSLLKVCEGIEYNDTPEFIEEQKKQSSKSWDVFLGEKEYRYKGIRYFVKIAFYVGPATYFGTNPHAVLDHGDELKGASFLLTCVEQIAEVYSLIHCDCLDEMSFRGTPLEQQIKDMHVMGAREIDKLLAAPGKLREYADKLEVEIRRNINDGA